MDTVVLGKSVRRDLFGIVNRERVDRELEVKLRQSIQEDNLRWNFSFQTETPLPGRLQWEKQPVEHTAAFYHESSWDNDKSSSPRPVCEETVETEQEICSANKRPAEVTPGPNKKTLRRFPVKISHN
ncbi:cyclin-dependent kinase inhibitor 1C-like [Phyllopteryx taeniolatus]|uniref:cyclin-dependent kinase inhibitor 1C-like n=1 Tax=Phyllopteryx taeniolatus TaxID=161469 RepID=UPI002AD3809F|nr:cyclin-dependent kinase inhibitor 1C-like [Phyllopteryx taeniolatus]